MFFKSKKSWYDSIPYPGLDYRDLDIANFLLMSAERTFLGLSQKQCKPVYKINAFTQHLKEDLGYQDFLEEFDNRGYRRLIDNLEDGDITVVLVSEEAVIEAFFEGASTKGGTVRFSALTNSLDLYNNTLELVKSLTEPRASQNQGKVYVLTQGYDGISYRSIGVAAVPLHLTNYNAQTQVGIKLIIQDLNSNLPTGKLTIIEGDPGTGKTNLIRALINEVPKGTFVVIPSHMVSQLGDPGIIPALIRLKGDEDHSDNITDEEKMNENQDGKARPIVFIVEDADMCLTNRGGDNMNSISAILNSTDGILGNMLDLRFIATTNAKVSDFDEAILREGRLSHSLSVGKLSCEEANVVYKRLMSDPSAVFSGDLDKEFILAEVYKKAKVIKQNIVQKDASVATEMLKNTTTGKMKTHKSGPSKKIGFN